MKKDDCTIKSSITKRIRDDNIEFIRLQFTDIFGFAKNVVITSDELEKALNGDLMFDGSSVDGFGRVQESDMYLVLDPNTYGDMPWDEDGNKTAHMFCDVYATDKKPFSGCPRYILKRALAQAEEMGFDLSVGPEGEFFLFHMDENDLPIFDMHDEAGYFDLSPVDKGEIARRDIIQTMKKYGFSIEASHHEVAPGQHEIDFKHDKALVTADRWMMFRQIVKNIAQKHGLYASFIPKPFSGENANAMHCNQSLVENGRNIFYDPGSKFELSTIAMYYIGGLLKHAKGMAAICNPTVNSYKRLKKGYEAPVDVTWSYNSRTAFIRIPDCRREGTRVELRTPDPTANPYLVFAVMLKAGLDGVKNKISPYEYEEKYACENSKTNVEYPKDLSQAIDYMKEDQLVLETLGDHAFDIFIKAKQNEWEEYETQVHDWEIKRYLSIH